MADCRLIIDSPNAGSWNMAADEYLLQATGPESAAILRLYCWSKPTLSLGYFQRYSDRHSHQPSSVCPCVRRRSGGGAIVHDQEITYSLIVPGNSPWAGSAQSLYDTVHHALVGLFNSWSTKPVAELSQVENKEAFLCFQRRALGDILIGANKVTGSAQRRHRDVTLQHGSILMRQSRAAPELLGLAELLEKTGGLDRSVTRRPLLPGEGPGMSVCGTPLASG